MELWPAADTTGVRGFVDVEHGERNHIATIELHDDGYREPTTALAQFADSPVV